MGGMAKLRGIIVFLAAIVGTTIYSGAALVVCLFDRPRAMIAWISRNWARFMLFPTGIRLTIEGRARLEPGRPYFFVGNHQSAMDIPILMVATGGDVRFMAKDALFRIPMMGPAMHRCGYVPIDREDARSTSRALRLALDRMKNDPVSFAVFPEGTRTYDGRMLPFRKGALKIGLLSGMPVVPFTINGAWRVNDRARFEIKPGPIRVVFHEPIPVETLAELNSTQLRDMVVGTIARELGETPDPAPTVHGLPEIESA